MEEVEFDLVGDDGRIEVLSGAGGGEGAMG
jgi:hypothetical protein